MSTDLSELQGEVLALNCAVAALLATVPAAGQRVMWCRFDELSDLVLERLDAKGKAGFSRALVRLQVRQPQASQRASALGRGQLP